MFFRVGVQNLLRIFLTIRPGLKLIQFKQVTFVLYIIGNEWKYRHDSFIEKPKIDSNNSDDIRFVYL